jgi:tetratricopeptide (TPR) repeat protein
MLELFQVLTKDRPWRSLGGGITAMQESQSNRLNQLLVFHKNEPNDPFCTYSIAIEYGKIQQDAEALRWLDTTLTIDRHYFYAYYQKAKVHERMGDIKNAKVVLMEGMKAAQQKSDQHAYSEMAELLASLE